MIRIGKNNADRDFPTPFFYNGARFGGKEIARIVA
jgi:hypothetical protein